MPAKILSGNKLAKIAFGSHERYLARAIGAANGNNSDAEDIVQDFYVKLSRGKGGSFSGDSEEISKLIGGYLNKVFTNIIRSYFQKRSSRRVFTQDELAGESNLIELSESRELAPLESLVLEEKRMAVTQVLQSMKPEDMNILNGFYFQDLSHRDLAQVLNKTNKAVKSNLFKARRRFVERYQLVA